MVAIGAVGRIRSSLWLVPSLCVIAGVVLSVATIALDRLAGQGFLPGRLRVGPDAAMFTLSTIASSMVTLAALVLTITMVVVQLAMGQFSPRIVRTILQDTPSQLAIGLFVGTFAHAMLTLREVRLGPPAEVPGIALLTAYLLVIASIILLVYYVHHLGQALRVAALIELVGDEMRGLVDERYPERAYERAREPGVVPAPHSGVVYRLDEESLVEIARDAGCSLELVPAVGDFVPAGAALLRVEPAGAPLDGERVEASIGLGPERTMDQDLAYGIRMLVDIAERGLAEPFLDPTTAVQAVDRLHDCLRQLAGRRFHDGRHHDEDGELRLTIPVLGWDGYVALAFDEIREAGAHSTQIPRRLAAAIDDLLAVVPPERRPALERQRRLLDAAVAGEEVLPDRQGIGSGPDALERLAA